MENNNIDLEQLVDYYEKGKKRKSWWRRILLSLSAVVVFCTVYALILPAITMVKNDVAVCGFVEHTHDESCYEEKTEISYTCTGNFHKHDYSCYDGTGNCICGRADYVIHTHDEACYDGDGNLVCTLPEIKEHTHSDSCTVSETVYICGNEGHEHTEECAQTHTLLVCGCESQFYHKHGEECYSPDGTLVCDIPEVTEAAYHEHTDDCYEDGKLVCSQIEILRHQHTDCVTKETEKVLICDIPEHKHSIDCLPDETEAVTAESEAPKYSCGNAYEHTHGEDCYNGDILVCTLTEHTHTDECLKNPDADTETAEDWERTLSKVDLSGTWADDVISVALSQLGYKESVKNFIIADSGEKKGYTRYGEWSKSPYADWSAPFCAFCLRYAEIDSGVMPSETDSDVWIRTLKDASLYHSAGKYTPKTGDLVFLSQKTGEKRCGFVYEVICDGDGNPEKIRTIEGNCDNAVCDSNLYSVSDSEITGYGELPENPEQAEKRLEKITKTIDGGITVTVTADPSALPFPAEELSLKVEIVENDCAGKLTDEALSENGLEADAKMFFDIKLIHDGKEVEPTGQLTVSISGLAGSGTSGVEVYHIDTENEKLEDMNSTLDGDGNIDIETDHFSLYAVSLLGATDVSSLTELPLTNGGNLTLNKDYVVSSTIRISRNTTLDLNGHNIYVTCDPAFNVTGGVFTVRDSQAPEASVTTLPDGTLTNSNTASYASADAIGISSYTLTNSSSFSPWGDGAVSNLFDNNPGTKMGGNVSGGSLTIEFVPSDTSKIVNEYILTSANDTGNYTTRAPKSWVLSGQRSGSTSWTQISSVSSMTADSGVDHVYTTTATRAYAKYRIVFQTNSAFQMADLKIQSSADEKLEYYVTETEIIDDSTGATSETVKKYTVTPSDGGMIVGSQNGRFITCSGGTVNLNGGYICNFSKAVNTEDSRGGAISATGGTVNIDGAVLAANKASDGGAIYVTGSNTVLNIKSGAIAGNTATRTHQFEWYGYGGGGVFINNGATVNMSGGYVTNNICSYPAGACNGGGAFMVRASTLNLSGGYITGNGGPGGGGIMTYRETSYNNGGKIYMTGGFVTANTSYTKEGGGISLDGYGYLSLTGGYVTNNYCKGGYTDDTFNDWGGGGIFVSDSEALLYIENVLVTENKAGGFGGGLAGCSTGRLNIAVDNVCASYDNLALGEHLSGAGNQKNEDHTYAADNEDFMNSGFQDYYCALSSIVSGGMLGDGTAMWTGYVDGEVVHSTSKDDVLTAASVMGLTSHPSDQDKANASEAAKVFINGNESPTHGGGVLANGYLLIGPQAIESFCRLEFNATKNLVNGSGSTVSLGSRVFNFAVEDEYGTVILNGTNDSSGKVTFDNRISFTSEGTYTFYAYELEPGSSGGSQVVPESTRYKITVEVVNNSSTITIDGKRYTKNMYAFNKVTVSDAVTGATIREYKTSDSTLVNNENHAVSLDPTGGRAFKNYNVTYVNITVKKTWVGSGNHPPVTVHLCRNGERMSGSSYTQTLSSSNNWTYTWSSLRTSASSGGTSYSYTVEEEPVNGYVTSYSVANSSAGSSNTINRTFTVTNTPTNNLTYTLNVLKVSAADSAVLLPGAEFELRDGNGEPLRFTYSNAAARYFYVSPGDSVNVDDVVTTLVTATNGYIRISDLPAGQYLLTETNAPGGYTKADDVTVVLNSDVPEQILTLTVADPVFHPVILPGTGGSGLLPVYLTGISVMLLCVLLTVNQYKKRRRAGEYR